MACGSHRTPLQVSKVYQVLFFPYYKLIMQQLLFRRSGGVVEIARINSSEVDAFSHVAWVPGLLPSTSLFSNSGCFVASDGTNLRVYQAVLDASNLLAEISSVYRKRKASLNVSHIYPVNFFVKVQLIQSKTSN